MNKNGQMGSSQHGGIQNWSVSKGGSYTVCNVNTPKKGTPKQNIPKITQ